MALGHLVLAMPTGMGPSPPQVRAHAQSPSPLSRPLPGLPRASRHIHPLVAGAINEAHQARIEFRAMCSNT